MTRRAKWVAGVAVLLLAVAGPFAYSSYRTTHYRNFGVVEEGKLYRSGQLTPHGLRTVMQERGIRTVVTLRASRDSRPHPDAWEADICDSLAPKARHVRLTPKVWTADENGGIAVEENIKAFLDILDDPANHPVLVHCYAGVHRTGQLCAVYRMQYQGWTADEAMAEMKAYGYDLLGMHPDVTNYLKAYKPRAKPALAAR